MKYTKLVVQFYAHLYTNCNRQGILFSTVQGKQVEVTTTDIAAALKCNDEHPSADAQLDEQSESFYISEIIEDICAGQYANDKKIMQAAGPNFLHNSSLWIPFCSVMCAH
jgi:hypothetical protein